MNDYKTTATYKQQQLDVLEAIKKMVGELGQQSCLAIAFEGVFEDAESNIENDLAESMKARWQEAEKSMSELNRATTEEIDRLRKELAESERYYDAANASAHALAEEKDVEIAAIREHIPSPDDLTDAIQLVTEKRMALDAEAKEAADKIVAWASEPETERFRQAVKDHRAAKAGVEYYAALLTRLSAARAYAGEAQQ